MNLSFTISSTTRTIIRDERIGNLLECVGLTSQPGSRDGLRVEGTREQLQELASIILYKREKCAGKYRKALNAIRSSISKAL